jgi:hypothetical protein
MKSTSHRKFEVIANSYKISCFTVLSEQDSDEEYKFVQKLIAPYYLPNEAKAIMRGIFNDKVSVHKFLWLLQVIEFMRKEELSNAVYDALDKYLKKYPL